MKTIPNVLLSTLLLVSVCLPNIVNGQGETPAAAQQDPIAIVGGTVHTVSGDTIENGTVIFDNGKIVEVGADIEIGEGIEQIDASGQHVYPGLFESHSQLGLTEIDAVRASIDTSEVGSINPNVRAHVAVNHPRAVWSLGRPQFCN